MAEEPMVALFADYENLAIGARAMKQGAFQIEMVLKRVLERGRIVYKRAYCDWSGYGDAVRGLHAAGIELVDIPKSRQSGKNSADIRMVVDALDLCYQKPHIDTFALLTGDSDFSPLVAKLKENDRKVIGCGVKSSTSNLLISSCDEFIYYDDLVREANVVVTATAAPQEKGRRKTDKSLEGMDQLIGVVHSLARDYDPLWGSLVKQTIRRINPGFNESYYGFRTFNDMVKEAESRGFISLEYDEDRGNYKIRLPHRKEPVVAASVQPATSRPSASRPARPRTRGGS
jgi:uncharacterized protein (TIGR00288 family)